MYNGNKKCEIVCYMQVRNIGKSDIIFEIQIICMKKHNNVFE